MSDELNENDSIDGKSIVITGGMGFIGSNLARYLVDYEADVTILDSKLDDYGANEFNVEDIESKLSIADVEVRDSDGIRPYIANADIVYHLAAQLSRTESQENPQKDAHINAEGTLNVLEASRRAEVSPRVVFTSSQAVYGAPESLPLTEETTPDPIDIYGVNKLAAEKYCRVYREVHEIETTVVRLTNVYGPRAQLHNPNYGVINKFIKRSLLDQPLTVYRPGEMCRDFIHISDVVEALLAVSRPTPSSLYLVATGNSTSIKELANRIVAITGSGTVDLVEWPSDWGGIRVGDITANPSRLITETDWEPSVTLNDGLKRTLEFYEANFEKYVCER